MLSVIILNVVVLNVVMLSVLVPFKIVHFTIEGGKFSLLPDKLQRQFRNS
jgi:hypothetical protein